MKPQNLEQKLQSMGGAVRMARSAALQPFVWYGVLPEYTNWREEQLSWRETVAFFEMSHHMTALRIEGADTIRLLSQLGVNSFANLQTNRAKQLVCCNPGGYIIGDGVLCFDSEHSVDLLGQAPALNWVQFHAETGGYKVKVERDEPTIAHPDHRRNRYLFQIQGPAALKVLEKASGRPLPEIKFFHLGQLAIAGRTVGALCHGMAGAPGLELFGPWEDGPAVKAAIMDAGLEFGIRQCGWTSLPAASIESGWFTLPLPAIFTGRELKAYRQWLPPNCLEALGKLSGSFDSDDISDYYSTPHSIGYGSLIKFDHDFLGRAALEALSSTPQRKKVTLVWNADDVGAAIRTLFDHGDPVQYIHLPMTDRCAWHYDKVLKGKRMVGLATRGAYSYNERAMLSLATLDADVEMGSEVTLVWGEDHSGSNGLGMERHQQAEIRTVVAPCPYPQFTRSAYAPGGWRAQAASAGR